MRIAVYELPADVYDRDDAQAMVMWWISQTDHEIDGPFEYYSDGLVHRFTATIRG